MPIPKELQEDRKKVRCPFCDNVLGLGIFVDGFQMDCLNKDMRKSCGRRLEINLNERGVSVEEVKKRVYDRPVEFPQASNQ